MDDDTFSRRANEFFGGSRDEMLCARLYRNRLLAWPLVLFIDWRFHKLRGERFPGHCRRVAREEAARMARDEPLARAMDVV